MLASNHPRLAPQERGYALRRCTLLDIRAVYRLERIIFPRDAYPYSGLALLFLWPHMINLKAVASDGSLAGFVSGIRARHPQRAWIVSIGVNPAHHRQGLGQWLLSVVEERLKRAYVRLTVRKGNTPAIALYRKMGYDVIECKIGYYRDGETGLVMEKCIKFDT